MFSDSSRSMMLEAAELAVRSAVVGVGAASRLEGTQFQGSPGIFVTLRKNGKLRGCIGRIQNDQALASAVGEVAVQSALSDPRFAPVTAGELDELAYEISVLTEMEPIGVGDIEIGRHGVEIEMNGRRAIFLPQVATEEGWNLQQMLNHLCRKAGLRDDDWKSSDARLYAFEAEVFGT